MGHFFDGVSVVLEKGISLTECLHCVRDYEGLLRPEENPFQKNRQSMKTAGEAYRGPIRVRSLVIFLSIDVGIRK